ncbi:MAG: hypothetical protein ACRCYU_16985 [Nocardioides sp.]
MHTVAASISAGVPSWLKSVVFVLAWEAIKFGMLAILIAIHRGVSVTRGIRTL